MAVYKISAEGTVGYFTDFEKAKAILKSKPNSDSQKVSLLELHKKTGEFYKIKHINVFESNGSLRKLTSGELDNLSELYLNCYSYMWDDEPTMSYSLYVNEFSYMKDSYLDDVYGYHDHNGCSCLSKHFGHLGPFEKNYGLYIIFDHVIQHEGDYDFDRTLECLRDINSKHTHAKVKLNELAEHMDDMNHLSLHTEKRLRLAFDMARIHLEIIND